MDDGQYSGAFLHYPSEVQQVLYPDGLPAVDNPMRPLGPKFIEMIQKHLPMLRIPEYGLARAANHLEDWINGRLPPEPLHDVSAYLGWVHLPFVLTA